MRRATSSPAFIASVAGFLERILQPWMRRSSSSGGPGKWKRTGPSGSALTNCLQVRIVRGGDLLRRALAEDHAVADHVDVVGDLERLLHVVGHHDRGQAERVVQAADQLDDLVERDRVEAGEGLVVHHQLRVGGDGARERHAPRHAAREVARHHVARAAQADRVQLHQHQAPHQLLGQVEVLADREGDVVVHREVAEQARGLEHHADLEAQLVELVGVELVHVLARDRDRAARGLELAADQLQQRGLARAAAAEDRHHLAARDVERQAAQDLQVAVGEVQVATSTRFATTFPDMELLYARCTRMPRSRRKSCSTPSPRSACAPTGACSRCPATRTASTRSGWRTTPRWSRSSTGPGAGARRRSTRSTPSRTSSPSGRSRSSRRMLQRQRSADFSFAVYPRRGGRTPELGDPKALEWIGRFLGRIHAVGATQKFVHRGRR